MDIVTIVLVLLFAVLVGDWINRFVPIPPPLVQIALGVLLDIGPLPSVKLEPDIFFLVFLPPLLFLDGWRIPKRDLRRDGATIAALALGLVVFTVVGIGFFINRLIPSMPLAVAFALAAVLSPTDPIAVSAVAAGAPVPRRLMHILEGEALLNDATGLVCLQFAVAAALTGTFSLQKAALSFLWLAVGGALVGIAVTWTVTFVEGRVLRRGTRDPGAQTLFSLLIPFAVYLLAERIHVSGILAAAVAGIAMTYVENQGQAGADTRTRRSGVWSTVQLALNGAIFVLLGEQLPGIFRNAVSIVAAGQRGSAWWLPVYVVAITAALLVLRFVWVWLTLRLVLLRARRRGETREGLTWHLVATTSIAGVKGAITLAGVLTLPLLLADGQPFPARDLAVLIAMGVILLSLLLASVLLPSLLRSLSLPAEPREEAEEDHARKIAGEAAMKAIAAARESIEIANDDEGLFSEAVGRAMERYARREAMLGGNAQDRVRHREMQRVERRLRLAGLRAERAALFRLRRDRQIEDGMLRRLVREIDLLEQRFRG
jgi:CPA1 family monovalent cation:H+ antiporter